MRVTLAPIALAALVAATPAPQGVTGNITPSTSAPADCKKTVAGTFEIQLVKTGSSKRAIEARDVLTLTLKDGVLTDAKGRIGSIVANRQFQFDGPPAQTGAVYTAGFALCPDNTLVLGSQKTFYQCLTSDYYNIYDQSVGNQCSPVIIQAINAKGASAAVTQTKDGQPQAATAVSQISDGQPQAATAVSQIADGQPQAPTGNPVTQFTDGQPQAPTGKPVSQISDGQPQAPTGKPVSQISDGQPQAPTGKPVTQIGDGQPQAPTGKPVTQIGDGQPQAPTGKPVTQIGDGQPQAPAVTPTRAGNYTVKPTGASAASTSPIAATGAAVANAAGALAVAAGALAAMLL